MSSKRSNMYVLSCSIDTTSRVVPIYCYMNLRYIRSSIGSMASNHARVLNTSNITDRVDEKLSLYSDTGESSSSNVVSRYRIPHPISTSRYHQNMMPRSVILSHMSSVCKYM